jgi:hypothetical protein
MELEDIMLGKVRVRKTIISCFISYVEYKSKLYMCIHLNYVYTLHVQIQ